jgi:hypothetical protein
MVLVLNDRVRETTTTTGTGAVALAGTSNGYDTFAVGVGNNNTTYYAIVQQDSAIDEWEVGLGTLDGTSANLTRTTVLTSSSGGTAITFSAGTKDVFVTYPASKTMEETLTTQGDLVYASSANTPARLAKGTANQVLAINAGATAPEWVTPTTGDITDVVAGTGLSGGGSSGAVTLNIANTAVTAASYTNTALTVNDQGQITAASSGTAGASNGFVIAMAIAL